MIYIFIIAMVILTTVFSIIARKKIAECESEQERRAVKAKWQLICGLMGGALILGVAAMIFLMF